MLQEALFTIEAALLHAAPIYYGFGAPRGDGSAVVVIPGFLGTDLMMMELFAWLRRIGYRPYFSGIGFNAECPNLLIQKRLTETIDRARSETGTRIHLIGHSLGGIIARAAAAQRPRDIASVITLGAPFRGTVAHARIIRAAETIKSLIHEQHGDAVLPHCYTGRCTCDFVNSLRRDMPASVDQTAVYTRNDGIVDWQYCITGDPKIDCEVNGTHIGLIFNANVYALIANRLSAAIARKRLRRVSGKAV
jgi:pimeloyl-ACP methyl ester carboxylesterase